MDEYEALANEIVLSACEDYRKGRRALKRDLGDRAAVRLMLEALRFLRSDWYKALTRVEGETIIKILQEEEI